jgi:hypothetical protein
MLCNCLRLFKRAAWKHLPNRFGHPHRKNLILFIAIDLGPLAPDAALLSIVGALYLGLLQCRFFDQDSLAFVALARPAKAHHHGGECAVLPSASGQSGVASGQVNQMVHIGACEAKRSFALHKQEIAPQQLLTAIGALRLSENVEHNEVLRF